ncbi:hypothetical protein [Sphingomonas sp.]|uniref:hypothetical protein n=1 Tax=Sphingomonas sp. TaxID=28214 RepID=UPI003B3B5EF2
MRNISTGSLAGGMILFTAVVLIIIGPPRHTPIPAQPESNTVIQSSQATAGGVTLASTSIDLPDDTGTFPDGPHVDIINANCTSCHSASMALNQPRLSEDQWRATVEKMRTTYKAPVPDAAIPSIVAYLTAMSAKLPVGPSAPRSATDRSGGTG